MERPVIGSVYDGATGEAGTKVWPLGRRSRNFQDADLGLLHRRFPKHCPYHLLHNLLQLHYGRHEMCTAAPFSVGACKHGSHAKPELTHDQMRVYAPAEGALLLLPFGLSCRACDDDVGLVAGCAECERLGDGDVCGGCRRVWLSGQPAPAAQILAAGGQCDLEEWQRAVGLDEQVPSAGGPTEPEECSEEEWLGEEEWEEEEEEEDWEDEAEEWDYAAGGDAASWDAEGGGDWYGDDGLAGDADGGASAGPWGDGRWAEDPNGGWSWVVDFPAPAAASAAPAVDARAPDAAAVASSAATAAVRAVLAAEAVPAAPAAASAPDISDRVRILELQLQLEELKNKRPRLS